MIEIEREREIIRQESLRQEGRRLTTRRRQATKAGEKEKEQERERERESDSER